VRRRRSRKQRGLIIAIDGPAGSGKSTTAKLVAKRLGYLYIDTGAMYRALTLKALQLGLDLNDSGALSKLADNTKIKLVQHEDGVRTYLDGSDVSEQIRHPEVTRSVGPVCSVRHVRRVLVRQQQELGRDGGVVMEGRDIGTVVFPSADLKVYLDASIRERAKRRYLQLKAEGRVTSMEVLEQEIAQRDMQDMSRRESPLRMAKDAVLIDTTAQTIEEQVDEVIALAREVIRGQRRWRVKTENTFYRFSWHFCRTLFRVLFRLTVEGEGNVIRRDGVILASNHLSLLDPPVIGTATVRELNYLAKKELFEYPILKQIITRLNAMPVDRGGVDRVALRRVTGLLRNGQAVLLFPEGTRSEDGSLGRARTGVGMVAVKSGKPIVPISISGTRKAYRCLLGLDKIRVRFGKPIFPERLKLTGNRRKDYQLITDEVMNRIRKLQGGSVRR